MEYYLEPLYEAFERLNKAKKEGDHDLVLQIEKEMQDHISENDEFIKSNKE